MSEPAPKNALGERTSESLVRSYRTGTLTLSKRAGRLQRLRGIIGEGLLLAITSVSSIAVLFIFLYIIKDAIPFFRDEGFREFFTSTRWYPSAEDAEFGALSIIYGSALVTFCSVLLSVPLGVTAAVCLSDVLPFNVRQAVKPVIEMLASIPSVAFGFFALVVLAPLMQNHGGALVAGVIWVVGGPFAILASIIAAELVLGKLMGSTNRGARLGVSLLFAMLACGLLYYLSSQAIDIKVNRGTNALNVSIILAIMVLPTVVSVSEDALQSVGRELREASYALGATRAETMMRVVIPAASSGICAAIILGMMRAVGETMVVWMASGNSAKIPEPWYNLFAPIRTLTATIAGDMGEADQVTGSSRYHVLFAMALVLLTISFIFNLLSEWAVRHERKKLRGE